jgi:hypothetical protein
VARRGGERKCGVCGNVREIRIRARDGNPDICGCCAPRRPGTCGVCGKTARIARKASDDSPAVGICCYRLPVGVCTDCGRERPCFHAGGPEPLCENCTGLRRTVACVDCGEMRPRHRRVDGGVLCSSCDRKRGSTVGPCTACGLTAPLIKGMCPACQLRERVAELAAAADPTAAVTLRPFLDRLVGAENPASVLRWFYTPGFDLTRRLLAGEIEISHQGLDEAATRARRPVAFVRAALVDAGVLEPRDEYSAQFALWHACAILDIAPGADRAHVRAYATWEVAHKLARASQRRGRSGYASLKYAKSQVTEAIKLVGWLHEQQLELAVLHQDLVDEWIASGSLVRRRIRPFVHRLERDSVTGRLEVAWQDRLPTRPSLTDDQRFALLRGLLHDRDVELRDRFAGAVLLLYGRPITHIAAMKTTAIAADPEGRTTLRLGRGEIPLPEPLGAIALELRNQRVDQVGGEGWLFGGRYAGTHITADTLLRRLKRRGIERSSEGRHGALLALAARLPAPILAERIGIHQARAAQWTRLAGAIYADYVAIRGPG